MRRAGEDIPVGPATVILKSVRVNDLDTIQRAAIEFAFGRFFSEEQPNDYGLELLSARQAEFQKAGIRSGGRQVPFRYRRFAGGSNLPRSRYYTLSEDLIGNDSGTLLCEMLAYVDHDRCGRFQAYDRGAGFASHADPPKESSAKSSTITIDFLDDDEGESPFVRHLTNEGLVDTASTTRVEIAYRTEEVQLERVLDLRQPSTQEWLHERVSKRALPGSLFEYAGGASQRLTWSDEAPTDASPKLEFADEQSVKTAVSFLPCESWGGRTYAGPDDFSGLLPYLIFPTRGGSPITDAIGRWLRLNSVEAMIYPSARNDVTCEVSGNRVVRTSGWNLVDYRDAPTPIRDLYLIVRPDSWRFASAPDGAVIGKFDVRVTPRNAPGAGSWWVRDQATLLRSWVTTNQRMVAAGAQMRRLLSELWVQPDKLEVVPVSMDAPAAKRVLTIHGSLAGEFARMDEAVGIPDPEQRISALTTIREQFGVACRAIPEAATNDSLRDAIAFVNWELAYHLGSTHLFNFRADAATNCEEAVRWLCAALATPIRNLNPIEWARTHGELSTAYKNRVRGDPFENREAAMKSLALALEVFTPRSDRRNWLITIKQRALVRLTGERSVEEEGIDIERAIAELEMVVKHASPDEEFDIWSSACGSLGAAYGKRHLGYFVENVERSVKVLEKLMLEVGDLESMMHQGATFERLSLAAATAVNLAGLYRRRRVGDSWKNSANALGLLRSARKFFAAIQQEGTLVMIDRHIAELERETDAQPVRDADALTSSHTMEERAQEHPTSSRWWIEEGRAEGLYQLRCVNCGEVELFSPRDDGTPPERCPSCNAQN